MQEVLPLTTIGIIIVIAIMVSILVKKFGQNPVLGYIIAGFFLGPFLLNFLRPNDPLVLGFGEMGLFILLFYLGLESSLKDFLAAGTTAFFLGILDIAGSVAVGFAISQLFGFSFLFSFLVGVMLFCTSTAIVAKFAFDNKIIKNPSTHIAISILIFQDLVAITMLVFITSFSKGGQGLELPISAVMFATAAFFTVYQLSQWVEDWLTKNGFGHTEMTLFALGIGLIVATLANFLSISTALGAHFAGFALAETKAGNKIKKDINFLRDFFLVFFFVSFGTTIFFSHEAGLVVIPDPATLISMFGLAALLVLAGTIVHGVIFTLFGPLFGLKRGEDTSRPAIFMGPLGEFVVIIATSAVVLLKGNEAFLLPTVAFLIIAVSVIIFQPMYHAISLHERIFGMLPRLFPDERKKTLIVKHTSESLDYVKKIAVNLFVVLAMIWVALLLYTQIPRLGVPLPFGRESTTALVFVIFAALPLVRAFRATKHLIHKFHWKKLAKPKKWPQTAVQ